MTIFSIKKFIASLILISLSQATMAIPLTASNIINNWVSGGSPVNGTIEGAWLLSTNTIIASNNHKGSLTSDVSVNSDFIFSVNSMARDNDTFGLLWGFQDAANHYRLSWGQDYGENGIGLTPGEGFGGVFDGFKIIKEQAGISSVLFSSETEYVQSENYNLSISGTISGFDVDVFNITTNTTIFDQSIVDTTFTSGAVGIHELFQANGNIWSDFDLNAGTPLSVPEPATLAIFGLGLIGLASRRFKK